jgi:hypothetical protein
MGLEPMDRARWNFIVIFGLLTRLLHRTGGRRFTRDVVGATAALVPIQRLRIRFCLKTFLWTALIAERGPDASA